MLVHKELWSVLFLPWFNHSLLLTRHDLSHIICCFFLGHINYYMLVILYIYVCTYYVLFFFLVKQKHLDDTEILKAKIGWECVKGQKCALLLVNQLGTWLDALCKHEKCANKPPSPRTVSSLTSTLGPSLFEEIYQNYHIIPSIKAMFGYWNGESGMIVEFLFQPFKCVAHAQTFGFLGGLKFIKGCELAKRSTRKVFIIIQADQSSQLHLHTDRSE